VSPPSVASRATRSSSKVVVDVVMWVPHVVKLFTYVTVTYDLVATNTVDGPSSVSSTLRFTW
jgi:hypothetical protein